MIISASDCFTDGAFEGLDDATDGALDVVFDGALEDAFDRAGLGGFTATGVTARGFILVAFWFNSGQSLSCSVVSPSSESDKSEFEASERQSASVSLSVLIGFGGCFGVCSGFFGSSFTGG